MKKSILLIACLLTAFLIYGQTKSRVTVYDDAFEGKKTASGDIFSQEAFTAAHDSLPFGTRVEILYVTTGKRVTVTVNDRISNAPGLFWISKAAARELDLYSIHPVEVLYVMDDPDIRSREPSPLYRQLFESLSPNLESPPSDPRLPVSTGTEKDARIHYGVQVYAAAAQSDALILSRRIQDHFDYLSYIERGQTQDGLLYRLIIGNFKTYEESLRCYHVLRPDIPHVFILER
ncbi:MAG: SPOR domain-containing protein [FCB group bacterium]|nr:SPOR domain-containing protein [FCB group bacterium]